jgi:hypothetical protein
MSQFILPARATDANNDPLSGALLYFYLTGTSTPVDVYSDGDLATEHANPVVADSGGLFPPIYTDQNVSYRVVLKTAAGVTIDEFDPYSLGDFSAASINYTNPGSGAATISAQAKMQHHLDMREFPGAWDGTTDDTVGAQAAINRAVAVNAILHLPPALKTGALTINGPCMLQGTGGKTRWTSAAGNYNDLTISASDVQVEDIYMQSAAKTGGSTILIACGTTRRERLAFTDIEVFDGHTLLSDSGSGAGDIVTLIMDNVRGRGQRGAGVVMTRLFAFGYLHRVLVDYVTVASSNFTGMSFTATGLGAAAGGLFLTECEVAGTAGSFTHAAQHGFVFNDMDEVHVVGTRADSCGGIGFDFTDITMLEMSKVTSALGNDHLFRFTTVANASGTGIVGRGRNSLSGAAAKDGIRFVSGCSDINLGTVTMRDCTGNGVHKAASQAGGILICGLKAQSNTGRAIVSVGNSALCIDGGQFAGNVAGNYDLGGNADYLTAQLNSGMVVGAGPGPLTA